MKDYKIVNTINPMRRDGKKAYAVKLGCNPNAEKPYATWLSGEGQDYFLPHYYEDVQAATKDLLLRSARESHVDMENVYLESQQTSMIREVLSWMLTDQEVQEYMDDESFVEKAKNILSKTGMASAKRELYKMLSGIVAVGC